MTDILLIAVFLLLPGLGAALAVAAPGAISIEARIALMFGLGYAVVAGTATFLALARVLSAPAFVAALVVVTSVVWALALRRGSPRTHAATVLAQFRGAPFSVGAGLALLVTVAATRPFYSPRLNLSIASPWRYWADGLEVAAAGQVPAETNQWGTEIPTAASKLVLNTFEGGVSTLVGPDPLGPMQGILAITAVGLTAAFLALGRELGLKTFAPLLAALAVLVPEWLPASQELSDDLSYYLAENIGRMVGFSALALGLYAIRAQSRWAPASVTGVMLALAGLTHLIPVLVVGLLLALYAIAVVSLRRTPLRNALLSGAVIALLFGVCFAGILSLSGGDVGFQRAQGAASYPGFPANVDPTTSFRHARLVELVPKEGHFFLSPSSILGTYASHAVGFRWQPSVGGAVLGALALLTLLMVTLARSLVPLAVIAWGLAATLLLVALLFSYRYGTKIPADFGVRRLFGYAAIPPALIVTGTLEAIARRLDGKGRIAAVALPLAAGALAVGAALDRVPSDRSLPRASIGLAVIDSVSEHVPCDVRMLANVRTAGTWEATTGRRALTEGMAPYLRPEVMAYVLPLHVGAKEFFRKPGRNLEFLGREDVDYLVIASPHAWIGTASGYVPRTNVDKVASLPGVRQVFRDSRVAVFVVEGDKPAGGLKLPERCASSVSTHARRPRRGRRRCPPHSSGFRSRGCRRRERRSRARRAVARAPSR